MTELAEPLLELSKLEENKGESPSTKDKKAMQALNEVEECELHFIRCIKPNDEKI